MNQNDVKAILSHVVEFTRPRWKQFSHNVSDLDELFIRHGYEQQGFETLKFFPLLKDRNIGAISEMGLILNNPTRVTKYERNFAGGLDAPFYQNLFKGSYGFNGKAFFDACNEFLTQKRGNPGRSFFQLLWWMLNSTNYLYREHQGSFNNYINTCLLTYLNEPTLERPLLSITSAEEWESFKQKIKPWKNRYLMGIGENTFDFIFGDIDELPFVAQSFKLDSSNIHFLQVTGIVDRIGELTRDRVIAFLKDLSLPYSLREINKGMYFYCSETERELYGYCRNKPMCASCGISGLCEKNL